MSKRKHEESEDNSSLDTSLTPPLFESTPIHDRSSTFIAIFTPSTVSPRSIQRHPPFESASHRILAWRKPSSQKSISGSFTSGAPPGSTPVKLSQGGSAGEPQKVIFETGSDDDGEQYAGKKLEKVLVEMNVQGTVVVARWYGGVLLGPVRFQWIQDSAREAVRKWKASVGRNVDQTGGSSEGGETKKVKVDGMGSSDSDGEQKLRLVKVLKERDTSVSVLRDLLAEKNLELKRKKGVEDEKEPGDGNKHNDLAKSPSTTLPDYDAMPLQRLTQMEKARDATLAWILKQIDTVEEKIKAVQE